MEGGLEVILIGGLVCFELPGEGDRVHSGQAKVFGGKSWKSIRGG